MSVRAASKYFSTFKPSQDDMSICVYHDVFGLQVTMHDTSPMKGRKAFELTLLSMSITIAGEGKCNWQSRKRRSVHDRDGKCHYAWDGSGDYHRGKSPDWKWTSSMDEQKHKFEPSQNTCAPDLRSSNAILTEMVTEGNAPSSREDVPTEVALNPAPVARIWERIACWCPSFCKVLFRLRDRFLKDERAQNLKHRSSKHVIE